MQDAPQVGLGVRKRVDFEVSPPPYTIIPSIRQSHSPGNRGTFNIGPIFGKKDDGHELDDEQRNVATISRSTIVENGAQPLFPPSIHTPSDVQILSVNVGRVVLVFRQIPKAENAYTFE